MANISVSTRRFASDEDFSTSLQNGPQHEVEEQQDSQCDNESRASTDTHRAKRARYVARACFECQSRKIRCQGGFPCTQCLQKKRRCEVGDDASTVPRPTTGHGSKDPAISAPKPSKAPKSRVTTNDVLQRLLSMERRLEAAFSLNSVPQTSDGTADRDTRSVEPESPQSLKHGLDEGQTFQAEPSMEDSQRECEEGDEAGTRTMLAAPGSKHGHLTPKPSTRSRNHSRTANRRDSASSWLPTLLSHNGVDRDTLDCRNMLQAYFDEIHPMYPFLHPPTTWQTCNFLCECSMDVSYEDLGLHGETRTSLAIFFVCIAIGRCTVSNRLAELNSTHSAGWSLYSVAMELARPLLEVSTITPLNLQSLQIMLLVGIYLIRLDACDKASRILANLVSSLYIYGLHRRAFYSTLSAFDEEISTRLWWSSRAVDRRLAFETGRPFFMVDGSSEIRPPLPVSDAWLTQRKHSTASMADLQTELDKELSLSQPSVVPFLEHWTQQYRIATDISKAIYEAQETNKQPTQRGCEYLNVILDHWWQSLPPSLRYQRSVPFDTQFRGVPPWHRKQCFFLFMRYHLLKLLIRRTGSLNETAASNASKQQTFACDAQCAQCAVALIQAVDEVPLELPRYSFTAINTLTNATMILLDILKRQPSLRDMHADSLRAALAALFAYCQSTWVSGKMVRTVTKLDRLIQSTLCQASKHNASFTDEGWKDVPGPSYQAARFSPTPWGAPVGNLNQLPTDAGHLETMLPSPGDTAVPEGRKGSPPISGPTHSIPTPASSRMHECDTSLVASAASSSLHPTLDLPDWATIDLDFERVLNGDENRTMFDLRDTWEFDLDQNWM